MKNPTRREMLELAAAVAAVPMSTRHVEARQAPAAPADTLRFFPGFKSRRVKTSGAEINLVHAGSGPPLLLMHGAPQTHVSMRLIAPELAKDYTVVVPDLRGYGDSSKPADGENHANYSKRAMALDQVEVMKSFGFDKFAVVGHDRGGRVGHRMALDHADKVTKLAVLDIVPTHYLYTHVDIRFIQSYFHWFNNVRATPGPENDLKAQYEAQKARTKDEVQLEYLRTSSDPANIHAMCEDYRAGASIDLQHDEADITRKIACPMITLWGLKGPMGRIYDVLGIWKTKALNVTGKGLDGGHNLQEDVPNDVLSEVRALLTA
ncbi:MAG TPA: alpha/beta hydrolase [Vicinamibacterales bacterium]